jgi:two-component system OmpR family sensor kinase
MSRQRAGSLTHALTRSLLVGLTVLWLAGVVGSGFVLKRLIDERSDDELQESAALMVSLVRYTDDLLVTAAVLGEKKQIGEGAPERMRFVYQIRDAAGRTLLHSGADLPELGSLPLREGIADAGEWRVATLFDAKNQRYVQFADPLAERREALQKSLLWLTVPLAILLAFAAYIVFRASRSLSRHVQRTANAVAGQDPQALGLLPLDGVVTEMKPAVVATNRLLGRLANALEAERSFTYNSAHELRTPIAAALAQAQLLHSMAAGGPLEEQARALVASLSRLGRIGERLLALARAEGAQPLSEEWVDLALVIRLTAGEFRADPRLAGRRLIRNAHPARVRGDLDAVGLALRNLVENALVHGAGGTFVRLTSMVTADGVVLAVTDDGAGVGARDIAGLTKRFARSANAGGTGAGLGLSIVETLTRRMGARLSLHSPPLGLPRGFEVRIVWPVAEP